MVVNFGLKKINIFLFLFCKDSCCQSHCYLSTTKATWIYQKHITESTKIEEDVEDHDQRRPEGTRYYKSILRIETKPNLLQILCL